MYSMKIQHLFRLTIASALLFAGNSSFAQPGSTTDPSITGGGSAGASPLWAPSKTPDGAYDRRPHISTPIPWQYIREEDILWKKRVWREIDTREKQNVGFRYTGDENTGGGMFIEILIDAINRGKIKAYSNFDDRFTQTLSKDQLREQLIPKPDTIIVVDPTTGQEIQKIINHDFDPSTITKYRIKEDWIFDRNQGQMVVRIVGLAPVKDIVVDGDYRGSQALFWLYYPDIRGLLAQYEVFNPLNDVARYTWDEFFESRQFSSRVTKVSNPFGALGTGGSDFKTNMSPMESLYESQHTAEQIFNKEHDMWVY
jgi:gliding motility associated protien GldN